MENPNNTSKEAQEQAQRNFFTVAQRLAMANNLTNAKRKIDENVVKTLTRDADFGRMAKEYAQLIGQPYRAHQLYVLFRELDALAHGNTFLGGDEE
jgi:hypothetical protein